MDSIIYEGDNFQDRYKRDGEREKDNHNTLGDAKLEKLARRFAELVDQTPKNYIPKD